MGYWEVCGAVDYRIVERLNERAWRVLDPEGHGEKLALPW